MKFNIQTQVTELLLFLLKSLCEIITIKHIGKKYSKICYNLERIIQDNHYLGKSRQNG